MFPFRGHVAAVPSIVFSLVIDARVPAVTAMVVAIIVSLLLGTDVTEARSPAFKPERCHRAPLHLNRSKREPGGPGFTRRTRAEGRSAMTMRKPTAQYASYRLSTLAIVAFGNGMI